MRICRRSTHWLRTMSFSVWTSQPTIHQQVPLRPQKVHGSSTRLASFQEVARSWVCSPTYIAVNWVAPQFQQNQKSTTVVQEARGGSDRGCTVRKESQIINSTVSYSCRFLQCAATCSNTCWKENQLTRQVFLFVAFCSYFSKFLVSINYVCVP